MSAASIPPIPPVNGTGFLASLMPNRGRAQFLRGVVLLLLGFGGLGSLAVAVDVLSEFHARHSWPVARGVIIAAGVQSNKGRPGNITRRTNYRVEYELKFSVPASQCLTGTISADPSDPMPCWGTANTRTTESWTTVNGWLQRNPLNSEVEVLHDPNGPGVKIAGQSAWLVYPWKSIFLIAGWMAFFLTFLNITQRRLREFEILSEDFDASPPPSSQPERPDDPIDLKLS
jgi:hypothetical protein